MDGLYLLTASLMSVYAGLAFEVKYLNGKRFDLNKK